MVPISADLLNQLSHAPVETDRLRASMPDPNRYGLERHEYLSIPSDRVDPSLFRLPQHRCLAEYWCRERDLRGGLPLNADFDPTQVIPALGYIMLLEPNQDATDFLYRLYGSRVVTHHGRDMTGRWLSSFDPPGPAVFTAQYRLVVREGVAVYAEHDAIKEVSVITRWCRLALPMAGSDGRVERLVVCNVPIRRESVG